MQALCPNDSLAALGCSVILVDHACEESTAPDRGVEQGHRGVMGVVKGLSASRVEVKTTTAGISPGAGARNDRTGVTLVCLSEPEAGAKQERRMVQ
jgi:hypothetical protein